MNASGRMLTVQAEIRRRLCYHFMVLLAVVIDCVNEVTDWFLYIDHLLVATPGEQYEENKNCHNNSKYKFCHHLNILPTSSSIKKGGYGESCINKAINKQLTNTATTILTAASSTILIIDMYGLVVCQRLSIGDMVRPYA